MASQQVSDLPHALARMPIANPLLLVLFAVASLVALGAIALLVNFVKNDYHAAVARGSGGVPSSFLGYLELNFFRLFQIRNARTAPARSPHLFMRRGFLERLPHPSRFEAHNRGSGAAEASSSNRPKARCYLGRSTFKNNNTALFARTTGYSRTKYHGEIYHAHPNDGSMHLNMHPADIKIVVESGWGERHPLARDNYWWDVIYPVPAGLTLAYSPRDEKELTIMSDVIKAAAWWMSVLN